MAPVYDFRHVELDKIGRGKRIVKPPGGECSDIFGVQDGVAPRHDQVTPRKTNNYMHSNIFSPDSLDSPHFNGHSPGKMLDTQDRLFGASPDEETPRKIVNRQRSSIFEDEVTDSRPKNPNGRNNPMNPITGEHGSENGTTLNGSVNGTPNGSVNGTPKGLNGIPKGLNGFANRHTSPESLMNGNSFRVRNPPGGKSSGIF